MKLHVTLLAAAFVAVAPFSSFGQLVEPAAALPPANAPEIPIERMLEVYGWYLGQEFQVGAFGLSDAEFAAFARGLASAAKGNPPPDNIEVVGPALQRFLQTRPDEVKKVRVEQGRAEETGLFESLAKKETVKKTESGLCYEIVAEGTGPKPGPSDTVIAHYTGTFVDGTVFDSTIQRGEPAEFQLNRVIPGWQEGLQLIGVGGRMKLYVPAKLGYGEFGRGSIPPSKALIFEVQLISVRPEQPQLVTPGQPQVPSATP
jgi:FKBP-type peptidyl-prolyl cis-trans isomerase